MRPAEPGSSSAAKERAMREYPPELIHGELCATRFGMKSECDCDKGAAIANARKAETGFLGTELARLDDGR